MATRARRTPNGTTLEEVALRAGVSRATVSRVVNGSPKVSPDVRRAVEAAVSELGYVPNRAARSLVTRRSGSIAVVITEPPGRLFNDPFFPRLLRGISGALAPAISSSSCSCRIARRTQTGPRTTSPPAMSTGRSSSASTATTPSPTGSPAAGIPFVVGRAAAADHRRELRRRRQPRRRAERRRAPDRRRSADRSRPSRARRHGRRASTGSPAIARRSTRPGSRRDPSLEATRDFTQEGGTAAMERLLAARPDIDAVFAASDLMAAGAMAVLEPPDGASPRTSRSSATTTRPSPHPSRPRLTSVRQPIEEMGHEMARLLIDARRGHGSRATARDPRHGAHSSRLERREAHALSRPATGGHRPDLGRRPTLRPQIRGRTSIGSRRGGVDRHERTRSGPRP